MKLTKPLIISTLLILSSQAYATDGGEILFDAKCSACHSKTRPIDRDKVVAPALMGVMRHLKMSYPDKTKAVAFIKDFTLNPTKEKSICMPQKIERFGLMPSQKGNVTKEELEVIASWMFDNFPPKGFRGMGHGDKKAQKSKAVQPVE
jgi:cytochrome c